MQQPRYESTEHTADLGLVAYGETLKEAFENAAFGMFDLMVEVAGADERDEVKARVEADDVESLLVAFLNELLYVFETRRLVLSRFEITDWDEETYLVAHARGAPLKDQERRVAIKACTYHDIRVERTAQGFEVEVLFDV